MNALITTYPWALAAVPVAIALVLGVGGRRLAPVAPWLSVLGPLTTAVAAITGLMLVDSGHAAAEAWNTSSVLSQGSVPWFSIDEMMLGLGWSVDSLTLLMLLVVGVVASCVVVFSVGYMHAERGWVRYFALISLFTGAMNLLTIADTLTTLFIGWELVGACSYLLIGFWYEKPSAASAAIKAFLTTRVGDVGLLLGIAILWTWTGSDRYTEVFATLGGIPTAAVSAAAVCLAVGAMGKSAQFPLHAWLPDAMEGPTPVSALIHAATMVAAGVFLVARLWPLFEASSEARLVLLAAGAVSAFGAALVAVVQRDIKKVLAYSTISQLGFMFAALGAGAWVAAFFHLVAHAAFKALLFLASGSVIHGSGTQDLHEMGGLRLAMPATFVTWLVGVLALAGVFPFVGFFSKDAVLEGVWQAAPGVAVLLFAASGVTAFYATRATRLAFFGTPNGQGHAHESPASMVIPLVVLAVPATFGGLAAAHVAGLLGHEPEPLALAVSATALAVAAVGAILGWLASAGREGDARTALRLGRLHRILASAYGWDALVDRWIVRPVRAFARGLWAVGDRLIADGAAEGSAGLARALGQRISALQGGDAQSYAVLIVVAFVVALAAAVWIGR